MVSGVIREGLILQPDNADSVAVQVHKAVSEYELLYVVHIPTRLGTTGHRLELETGGAHAPQSNSTIFLPGAP